MKSQSLVNHDFFINCNTPESAYLLGFIWGDGCLSKCEYIEKRQGKKKVGVYNKTSYSVKIECNNEDLSSLVPVFNFSGKWTEFRRHRSNRKPELRLSTCNKQLYDFMDKYNYNIKSGGDPTILNIIPEKLKHYWWRGYFDADGCIHKLKNSGRLQVSISSTYEQDWTAAIKLSKKLNIAFSVKRIVKNSKSKYSYVRITSKQSIGIFLDYIYQGKQFGLARKKEIYDNSKTSSSFKATISTSLTTP